MVRSTLHFPEWCIFYGNSKVPPRDPFVCLALLMLAPHVMKNSSFRPERKPPSFKRSTWYLSYMYTKYVHSGCSIMHCCYKLIVEVLFHQKTVDLILYGEIVLEWERIMFHYQSLVCMYILDITQIIHRMQLLQELSWIIILFCYSNNYLRVIDAVTGWL